MLDQEFWKASSGALWDIAESIRALVTATERTIGIIDSTGPACMGLNMNDPDTPQRFAAALLQCGLPLSVAIAQVNRAGDLTSPYGSTFWRYWSRAMWSVERAPTSEGGPLAILLTDRKANNYATAERLLTTVTWEGGLPVASAEQPYAFAVSDQVSRLLDDGERRTQSAILEELNASFDEDQPKIKSDSVRKALGRGESAGKFMRSGKSRGALWARA